MIKISDYLEREFQEACTFCGLPIFYIVILMMIYRDQYEKTLTGILVFLFAELICLSIKLVYHKKRPTDIETSVLIPAQGWMKTYYEGSFPSVHTMRITILAIFVIYTMPYKLTNILFGILVFLVGYSRIYLKKHDWIDVTGGGLIGLIIGYAGQHFLL